MSLFYLIVILVFIMDINKQFSQVVDTIYLRVQSSTVIIILLDNNQNP
jgi:hypothetical protein